MMDPGLSRFWKSLPQGAATSGYLQPHLNAATTGRDNHAKYQSNTLIPSLS